MILGDGILSLVKHPCLLHVQKLALVQMEKPQTNGHLHLRFPDFKGKCCLHMQSPLLSTLSAWLSKSRPFPGPFQEATPQHRPGSISFRSLKPLCCSGSCSSFHLGISPCLVHAHPAFHQPQQLADACHHQGRGEQKGRKGCQSDTVSQRQKLSSGWSP